MLKGRYGASAHRTLVLAEQPVKKQIWHKKNATKTFIIVTSFPLVETIAVEIRRRDLNVGRNVELRGAAHFVDIHSHV